jgi:hypothetical protein
MKVGVQKNQRPNTNTKQYRYNRQLYMYTYAHT